METRTKHGPFAADSSQPTRPPTGDANPTGRNGGPGLDVANPRLERCLVSSSADDAKQRLADYEQRIGGNHPKTSVPQRKLLARDQLIDYTELCQ